MGFNYSSKVVNFLLTQIIKNILIAFSLFFTLVLLKILQKKQFKTYSLCTFLPPHEFSNFRSFRF